MQKSPWDVTLATVKVPDAGDPVRKKKKKAPNLG